MTADRRPALTREHHLRIFANKHPFTELATLGFRRCVLSEHFTTRRGIIPIRVATLSDAAGRVVTVDVDENGNTRGHFTVVVGAEQPVFVAETASAALQLVASAPGTPTSRLLRIADVSLGPQI